MINNDILRRLVYIFDLNDLSTLKIFTLSNKTIEHSLFSRIVKREDDENFELCSNEILNHFLDGLIILKRGLPESKVIPKSSTTLNNNIILRKIKIALTFKDADILACLKLVDFKVGKSELSALFRKKDHKHYKVCGDQFLRNFLLGLSKTLRP
ncbi:MAG: hypothetical protein COB02_05765 [Candidatus Cloacimonadota bacterium]|nr:MAG: hypothetical protein COB02_05765 [Candidatus Cloacimonadota bacterium]